MTAGLPLLSAVDKWRVFEPMSLPWQRAPLYVPFSALTGDGREQRLARAVADGRRAAVIGPIGCGKSSLIEHVLLDRPEDIAVVWISTAFESRETLTVPVEFVRHILLHVARWGKEIGRLTRTQRSAFFQSASMLHAQPSVALKHGLGAKFALPWFEATGAREVTRTIGTPEIVRAGAELVETLNRFAELLDERGLRPLLVVDDLDRFVRQALGGDPHGLTSFFGETCRLLSERGWGIVLAVQPDHSDNEGFRHASRQGVLNEEITMSPFANSSAIRRILDERVAQAALAEDAERGRTTLAPALAEDVFETGYDAILFRLYRTKSNLRPVLRVAEAALRDAIDAGHDRITVAALQDAAYNT